MLRLILSCLVLLLVGTYADANSSLLAPGAMRNAKCAYVLSKTKVATIRYSDQCGGKDVSVCHAVVKCEKSVQPDETEFMCLAENGKCPKDPVVCRYFSDGTGKLETGSDAIETSTAKGAASKTSSAH